MMREKKDTFFFFFSKTSLSTANCGKMREVVKVWFFCFYSFSNIIIQVRCGIITTYLSLPIFEFHAVGNQFSPLSRREIEKKERKNLKKNFRKSNTSPGYHFKFLDGIFSFFSIFMIFFRMFFPLSDKSDVQSGTLTHFWTHFSFEKKSLNFRRRRHATFLPSFRTVTRSISPIFFILRDEKYHKNIFLSLAWKCGKCKFLTQEKVDLWSGPFWIEQFVAFFPNLDWKKVAFH